MKICSEEVIQQKWSRKIQPHSCKMIALGGEKMQEQIEAVQRMQEYIEKHLRENISFTDVAKVSLFSPWYARRLFLTYTGVTPSDYIRKLRLKQSALKLRDEDVKVLDVAMDYGFKSWNCWTVWWIAATPSSSLSITWM